MASSTRFLCQLYQLINRGHDISFLFSLDKIKYEFESRGSSEAPFEVPQRYRVIAHCFATNKKKKKDQFNKDKSEALPMSRVTTSAAASAYPFQWKSSCLKYLGST